MAAVSIAEPMLSHEFEFMKFVADWNKSYATREEFMFRMGEWLKTEAFIQEVNAQGSEHTHTAGHNKFSDMTREEYKRFLTLPKTDVLPVPPMDDEEEYVPNGSKDWRTGNCVTAVKNQEQCGSCYAFSATETVESSYCIHQGGKLWTLSPQQIVDCSQQYGNQGCNGGWYFYAWNYLQSHGQEEESAYPYKGKQTSCTYNASAGKVKTTSQGTHISQSSSAIMRALDGEPVSVAIDAEQYVFQTYQSGTITSSSCGTSMDHAVAAVGYNSSANPPYYIVRNSWGASWGDKGYVQIEATSSGKGVCGINQMVYSVETKTA